MPTAGPNSPTLGANNTGVGTAAWGNETWIYIAGDGLAAQVGSLIRSASSDHTVKLWVGGAASGANKAVAGVWPAAFAYQSYTWSPGAGDAMPTAAEVNASAFGAAIAATNGTTVSNYLVATGFGFALPAGATVDQVVVEWMRGPSNNRAGIDHCRITVAYTDASGQPAAQRRNAVPGATPGRQLFGRGW